MGNHDVNKTSPDAISPSIHLSIRLEPHWYFNRTTHYVRLYEHYSIGTNLSINVTTNQWRYTTGNVGHYKGD